MIPPPVMHDEVDTAQPQAIDERRQVRDTTLEGVRIALLVRLLGQATTNVVESDDSTRATQPCGQVAKGERPCRIPVQGQHGSPIALVYVVAREPFNVDVPTFEGIQIRQPQHIAARLRRKGIPWIRVLSHTF